MRLRVFDYVGASIMCNSMVNDDTNTGDVKAFQRRSRTTLAMPPRVQLSASCVALQPSRPDHSNSKGSNLYDDLLKDNKHAVENLQTTVDMHYRVHLSMFGHLGLLATCRNISSEGSQLPEMALLLDIASPPLRAHPQRPHTRGARCPRPAEKKSHYFAEVLDLEYMTPLRWHEHVELHCRVAQTARVSNHIGSHHRDICFIHHGGGGRLRDIPKTAKVKQQQNYVSSRD
ncbi:hypothetical protein NEUTE1DRAFT_38076 [Neurospora tetrasperma FGSC 2508]|uniref:Uncharacterized protein n=1 Tax=Neurospora tetrasperma (strain FGSC 2508 / ATCC MYA-4615 / P0657) TaxID=510951 RepID=F8MIQ5_NEUT8|nr:uncharacterized protein NEUTE1DRAFT_38076 [Neurospora tetrasperma FGSC 2508]EGO59007.1 hypothetical protein NEUTE1DRAFT_38076 [Neurospora tetrasperma FGSC 2508]EGZ73109.1 hypothetical protein NEUTE2DRAFT_127461 [Neurospora tetrasperma FGSC 2509]